MTMEHDRYREMLGRVLDGTLPAANRPGMMTHLAGCEECRAELEAISSLRAEARSLPRGIAPSRDLWDGIAPRLAEREAGAPVIELDARRRVPRAWGRWAPLAAAAVLLVVASSGLTLALMRGQSAAPVTTPASGRTAWEPQPRPTTALAAFRPAEVEFENTVTALEAELNARRGSLSPETVATIEENLAIIDQAIAEARAALQADPGSADLSRHLSDVYRHKVDLLGSAVKIAT